MTNTIGSIRTGPPQSLPRRLRPAHRHRYGPWRVVPSRIRPYVILAEQRGELLRYGHCTPALPEEAR